MEKQLNQQQLAAEEAKANIVAKIEAPNSYHMTVDGLLELKVHIYINILGRPRNRRLLLFDNVWQTSIQRSLMVNNLQARIHTYYLRYIYI